MDLYCRSPLPSLTRLSMCRQTELLNVRSDEDYRHVSTLKILTSLVWGVTSKIELNKPQAFGINDLQRGATWLQALNHRSRGQSLVTSQ